MLSRFRIFLVLAVFCLSCKQKLSKEAFIRWYQTVRPLERETDNKGFKIRVRYFPVELLMMDNRLTEQELDSMKDKIWLTVDVDRERFFASGNARTEIAEVPNANKLEVTLRDKEPEFSMNEYSTGKGAEGRWILGWNEACLKEDKLLIKIDDQSIEIPVKEILPEERPILKI